jgi:hypothetical protein
MEVAMTSIAISWCRRDIIVVGDIPKSLAVEREGEGVWCPTVRVGIYYKEL